MIDAFMYWITDISSVVTAILSLLLIYGFRRYIHRPRADPIDFIGTGIWITAITFVARTFWWDILPDVIGVRWSEVGLGAGNINWIFNTGFAVGTWFKLRGYYLLVEQRAPGRYSTLTAVFYPRRLRLWIVSREEDE